MWIYSLLLICMYCLRANNALRFTSTEEYEDASELFDNTVAESLKFFFTQTSYNATISENAVGKTYVTPNVKMGIYLTDPTVVVNYKIKQGDDNKLFKAEERVVGDFCFMRIRMRTGSHEVINRERKDKYHLLVRATGRHASGPKFSTQVEVTIHVLDVNDMSPLFDKTSYVVDVAEDTPLHKSILQVSATDADFGINSEIYYSFSQMSDIFAIHPTSGIISLTRPLSFIEQNSYLLDVVARDRGPKYGTRIGGRKASVNIRVIEVNAHAPTIRIQNLPEITEHGMVGTVYAIVYVRDKDYGSNGQIGSVEIVEGNSRGYFMMQKGKENGQYDVKVNKSLTKESSPEGFNLTIQVTDKGNPPRFSTKIIPVLLSNKNDQVPQFEKDFYNTSIEECVPIHTPVLFVKAIDRDPGKNGELRYKISNGNDLGWFVINPKTSLLTVIKSLDAEQLNVIELVVTAEDQANHAMRKTNHVKVRINIVDCNDNNPVFNESKPVVSIDENMPVGSNVYKIAAYDVDHGDNGYLSYSLANANEVPFDIHHFTGQVTTTKILDYESMRRSYSVRIRASDWGTPFRRESEVILRVKLRDVNDNRPQFEKVNCNGHLSRESPIGTKLVTVSAIDFDAGNIISYQFVAGNDDACFKLDSSTGKVETNCDLSASSDDVRSLFVTATDSVNVAMPTTINITLVNNNRNKALSNRYANVLCTDTDVTEQLGRLLQRAEQANLNAGSITSVKPSSPFMQNSYRPRFPHTLPLKIEIPEGKEVGEVVGNFKAIDGDHGYNGRLTYVIAEGNDDSTFKMDTYTGDLIVMNEIDRETKETYTISIIVSDMGDIPKDKVHILSIEIRDVNDNAPVFEKLKYSLTISEDTAVNTTILQVKATDVDILDNAIVTYSILTDVKEFHIEPYSGLIHIAHALDREQKESYEILVQAKDSSKENPQSSVVVVNIHISDVNDNPPIFHPTSYHIHVREDIPVGSVIMTLSAHDPDKEGGGVIRYMMTDISGNKKFIIDHQTGTLRAISELDFEKQPVYNLTVEARDRGVPSLMSKCHITIEVVDVNENLYAPLFKDFVFQGHVKENQDHGTEVIQVIAHDDDANNPIASPKDYDINYSIVFGSGVGRFTIDNKGIIRTNTVLDRESKGSYWLTVVAEDSGTVTRSSWVEVLIEVDDVNDNTPQTLDPVYYPQIKENSNPGTPVLRLQARDHDDNSKNKLSYRITSGNPQAFFTIDSVTGLITTTSRTLDREKQEEHILEVTVSDNGSPAMSSTTRVVVHVKDDNDEVPMFTEMIYRVRIPEMPASKYDMPLFRVIARDRDTGINGDIDYSIIKGNGRFKINLKTGMIYSQKEFAVGPNYELTVRATDNGKTQLKSSARVVFEVVHVPATSLHAPVFNTVKQNAQVYENDQIGHSVAFINAVDDDGDRIWYSIVDGNSDERFSIDTETGHVIIAAPLDWEIRAQYNLTIQASDAIHYTRTWLHVTVSDINDNRPQFSQNAYRVHLSENSQPGSTVLTVTATDMDEDQRLFYTIHATRDRSSKGKFKINSETDKDGRWTGVITTVSELNREAVSRHELTIMVRDQGAPSKRSLARVTIYIDDHNDHAPEFLTKVFEGRIFETAAAGTGVLRVMAIDRDKGVNAELRYAIVSGNVGNTFTIESSTGLICVTKPLDRHAQSEYVLTVKAVDSGTPSHMSTVNVHIEVTVASNAPPKFKYSEYTTEIEENKSPKTYIMAVSAESQSSVVYTIVSGDDKNFFSINPNSGVLISNVILDFEEREFFNLTIRGTNMMSSYSETSVQVHVIDLNDNHPVFMQDVYVGNISEEASVGSVVLDSKSSPLVIKATDRDSDMNSLLIYSIVEPHAREIFEIDTNTGAIKTIASLDHETLSQHIFTVQVEDMGNPRKSAEVAATVHIYVIDINDSPPVFDQELYTATVLLPTYQNVVVLSVHAEDKDSELFSRIDYEITSGNRGNIFQIDPKTGAISVVMVREMFDSYQLVVAASDGSYQDSCNVKIHVDLTQNSGLQFTKDEYSAEINENEEKVIQVTQVQAVGQELNEYVSFSILNPHVGFQIGKTSGVIQTTGFQFDRETQDNYTLVIQVMDTRTPPRIAQTLVKVAIKDVNDNTPKFMKLPYSTMVSLDTKRDSLVRKVYTVDHDLGSNGEVRYGIVSGDEGKFNINDKTGEITVRRPFIEADENREFNLIVKAQDQGQPSLHATVSVPITIKNKNTPVFSQQHYEVSTREDVALYTAVISVEANSPTGRKLIYSIAKGTVYGEFDVDFSTGSVIVIDKLDYETHPVYNLVVRATDTMTGSFADASVHVKLQDVNDNSPKFDSLLYTTAISEASPVGTSILMVKATDRDVGNNALIEYIIETSVDGTNDSNYFHIDSEKGIILSKQKLDHEYKDKLKFFVTAIDSGVPSRKTSVQVNVVVADLNDNSPVFDHPSYEAVITDLAKRGQFVTIVTASDKDSSDVGVLTYSIVGGNEKQAFVIDEKTGIISLSSLRRPDLFPNYLLNVSVTDGVFKNFARVKITVRNSNSHVPVFSQVFYDVDISENLAPGTRVVTVKARDRDQGIYGDVVYALESEDMKDVFRMDTESGELCTNMPLNREETSQYLVSVSAKDGVGRAGYTTVRVNVADQGDQRPQFTQVEYRGNVYSKAEEQTFILKVSAVDTDLGTNGVIEYSLYDGDGIPASEWFDIEKKTGIIKTKRSLTRKENEVFQFFVRATDKGSPPKETDVPVEVFIMNEEDTAPIFEKTKYNYFISEDRPRGSIIATIPVLTNDTVRYSIVPGGSAYTNDPIKFEIDPENGKISVTSDLDREVTEMFELSIRATTETSPSLVGTCKVTVHIMDVNDNVPKFESDPYEVQLAENAEIGSKVIQVHAHDKDTGANADISYRFAAKDSRFSNIFFLEAETGWLTTLVALDRESTDSYEFDVVATDRGTHVQLSDVTTVNIKITDHNDEPPVFSQAVYKGSVNEDALPGTVVIAVVTHDLDLGANAEVCYSITGGDPLGQFAIKSTGEVYVYKQLDRETLDKYYLVITATDGAFISRANVGVTILDANDNVPVCEKPAYQALVVENKDLGSFILQVAATDYDQPGTRFSTLTYTLEDSFGVFNIEERSGIISNIKTLDRETVPEYKLAVRASDGGGLHCTMDVVLTLTDVNDNPPVFVSPEYIVMIPEDAPVHTLLTRVAATDIDLDINRKVQYALRQDISEYFTIDPISGIVSLRKQVDRERQEKFNITIYAHDQGTPKMTATTQLIIHLLDVNDNPPEFEHQIYQVSISEAFPVGTTVMRVFATSRDSGINAEITYAIAGGNEQMKFRIDTRTGAVTLKETLDYESAKEYFLNIEAKDKGTPPLSSSAVLKINVTDHNDNSPLFARSDYHVSVREDMEVGSSVLQVLATDLDSEPNAMVMYYIVTGDDKHQFAVQQKEGYVTVNEPLDRELKSSYSLEIRAMDSGSPQLTGSTFVHITILDVNDMAPTFEFDNYTAAVQEDRSIGHQVVTLLVSDGDLDPNAAPFHFDIVDGNKDNEFRISRDGVIFTTAIFDRNIKNHYKLTVRVFDNGKPTLYSDTDVDVHIIEESAYPPTMKPLQVTVTANGDEYCGDVIGRVFATDQDPYDSLVYSLSHSESNIFNVNASDGTVEVKQCLDAGHYTANVTVSDGKYIVASEVRVHVIGIEESMASSAVVMRLQNVSPEEFVRDHRADVIGALTQIFSVPSTEVHLVGMQPASDFVSGPSRKRRSTSSNLDVLIAIGQLGSNYVPRKRVRKQISQSKADIEKKTGLRVVKIIGDVCPDDACGQGTCVTEVYFLPDEGYTIIANGESYVSAKYELGYTCNCPQGYKGVVCDVVINLCEPNPCPAPRQCVIDGLDYTCECPPGTSGEDCEFDCDGPDCFNEITFSGESYVSWKVLIPMEKRLHLAMEVKTVQNKARLMHVEGTADYSILEIENGLIQFRFDCGSGEGFVRVNKVLVNDGHWHSIFVERNSRTVKVTIDSKYTADGSAPIGNALLNSDGNIYFGAAVQVRTNSIRNGFKGCMKNMKLDNVKLPLSGSSSVGVLQKSRDLQYSCRGVYIPGVCSSSPCQHGGSCIPVGQESFTCKCRSRFTGSRCETDTNPCVSNPCMHGGRCENSLNSYTCICSKEFQGIHCDLTNYCKVNPCRNNGGCSESPSGPVCQCYGYTGLYCENDVNECEKNPCKNGGKCINTPGSFKCNCSNRASDQLCEVIPLPPSIKTSQLPLGLGIEELIGIAVAAVVIFTLVVIFVVIIRCRRRRKRHQPLKQDKNQKDLYYSNSEENLKNNCNKLGSLEDNHNILGANNPSHTISANPPPVPARPTSYTPSIAESMNTLNNYGMDAARNYGSAGDDLQNIPTIKEPIVIPEFLQMKDFDVFKPNSSSNKSPPPPPRKIDSQGPSTKKSNWDPNIAENYPDEPKKQHKVMPTSNGQSPHKVPLLNGAADSVVSLPITDGDGESMQGYHWDTSDWNPDNNPLPELAQLPSNSVHNTPLPSHRNPDNIPIDPSEYSYTDLQDIDDIIDPEYVCESEFTENEYSDNEINDIDSEFDPPDYQDILKGDFQQYMPHYSDIENSQAGDSRWGSRDIELNGNFDSAQNIGGAGGDDEVIHYGFSLPRPRNRHFRPQHDNRFSGEFTLDYDHIPQQPLDDMSISMAGYQSTNASVSSISNLCDIEDSEANLSDSDEENQSNESTKLVKSNTNLHTVV